MLRSPAPPVRRTRRLILLAAVLALCVPVAALAAHPGSGKWGGKLKTNGAKVTFKVSKSGKRLKGFAVVQLPVYCYGTSSGGLTTKVFLVPSAKVKQSGKFKRTYKTKNNGGQVDGTLKVSGRFKSAKKASGKLSYVGGGCSSGPVKWSAKRKH